MKGVFPPQNVAAERKRLTQKLGPFLTPKGETICPLLGAL